MKLIIALLSTSNAIRSKWQFVPYETPDYIKKNNADIINTTRGYLSREDETREAAIDAGYQATKYLDKFGVGEAMSPH